MEHEYILAVPGEPKAAPGGSIRTMSSGKGLYKKFSRATKWVPYDLPALLVRFSEEKSLSLPMAVELDHNGLPALELVTRDPRSRTVGGLVRELRLSLQGVDAVASSTDFLAFAAKERKAMAAARGRLGAARKKRELASIDDTVAAAKFLNASSRRSRPPPLVCEHGADVATTVLPFRGNVRDIPIYTGSLHINVTLPHSAGEDGGEGSSFMMKHRRAAVCLQWLEPLLVAVLGSPHPFQSVDGRVFPAMSYRHSSEEYTGMVTNDIASRGINDGRHVERIRGRRALHLDDMPDWEPKHEPDPESNKDLVDRLAEFVREDLRWMKQGPRQNEVAWVKGMKEDPSGAANSFVARSYAECPCVPVLGSDYRRDNSARSGLFGFEFRALDRVPVDSLADVMRLLWYAFDASVRLPRTEKTLSLPRYNAVRSGDFVGFMVAAAKQGSAAKITKDYADALTRVLKLGGRALTGDETAHEALQTISDNLFEAYGNGAGAYSRYVDITENGVPYQSPPGIPDLNRIAKAYHEEQNEGKRRKK